ncbi:DUF11 domain-containing protein [Wenzhouxiangella sp. AB-CW3]|uniref:DUF7507 domain-containing protein n=1 Tax=Wenzhouxiangella sp. AB-CW3 TaxID=2771012 RepID=UPI00168B4633|nr:SdrD B-like domain-containing protein [Wenzhouxiangella sp. AB-CW3]QOC23909.1 DUF11 domain-containing protein [Wenzhouxiangella sp. AB-CW3]
MNFRSSGIRGSRVEATGAAGATGSRQSWRLARRRGLGWLVVLSLMPGLALAQNVDLVLNHDVIGPTTINASETATFEVTIDNTNPSHTGDASDVVLTYEISATDTLVSATPSQGSCGAPDGSNIFTCSLGTIEWSSDGTTNVTVDVVVRGTGTGVIPPYTMTTDAEVTTSSNDVDLTNNQQERNVTVLAGTDLGVVLDSSPLVVASGGIWSHTITLENFGPIEATTIVVHFDLQIGDVVLVGSLPSGCSAGGPGVVCELASLALGDQHVFGPIETQVAAIGGSNLQAEAFIQSLDQVDGNAANDFSIQQVDVTAGSDLSVSLSHTGGTILENQPFELIADTFYTGEVPDAPELQITLDPGLTFQSTDPFSQNGWGCTISGQVVSCTYPDISGLAVGANQVLGQLTVGVVGANAGTYSGNVAEISSDTTAKPDPDLSNNTDSTSVSIEEAQLDLRIRKDGPQHHLRTIGDDYDFSYEVRIRNHGNIDFWGELVWTDTVPEGLAVTSIDAPGGWDCSAPYPVSGPDDIECSRTFTDPDTDAFGTGSNIFFTVNAYANGDEVGDVVNEGCLTTVDHDLGFLVNEGIQNCNTATIDAQELSDSADLRVIKTADPDPVTAGNALTYTLEIVNDGPATAFDVTLTDTLGNLFTGSGGNSFQGVVIADNAASGGDCGTSGNPGNPSSRTLICEFTEVPECTPGDNCPTIEVTILPHGAPNSGVVFTRPNSASAFSSVTADPDYTNNEGSVDVQVEAETDLELEKTVTTWTGDLGTSLNYRIVVRNIGASGASSLELTDTLPHDVTYLGVNPGGSASCPTQPTADSTTGPGNDQVICTRTSLARGATWTIDIQTRPNHGIPAGTTLVNTASVTTDTDETDLGNNDDTADAEVGEAVVDLATVKTDIPDPVFVGDTVTYTVRVTNNGPSVAEDATIYDFLPSEGFRFIDGSVTFYDVDGGDLNPIDPSDLAGLGIECTKLPDDDDFGTGYPANQLEYLWPDDILDNPNFLDGIWDPVAGDLEGESDIICNMGFLESGQARAIRYVMTADARGVYFHHAISRSREHRENGIDGPDPVPSNDVTRERTTVRSIPDVDVAKTVSTDPVALLEPFHYTITFTNNNANDLAHHPEVRDDLPSGMELTGPPVLVSGAPLGSVCSGDAGDTGFICDLDEGLPPLGEVAIEVPVRVISGGVATLDNRVNVHLDTDLEFDTEPDPVVFDDEPVDVVISSIAGRVYHDDDLSGVYTPSNPPIADVTITLEGETPWGDSIDRVTTTASDGTYFFDNLPPGTYELIQTQPSGWLDGPDNIGSEGGNNPEANRFTDIPLGADIDGTEYNFGEYLEQDNIESDLSIDKVASTAGPVGVDEVIEYTITATNTGNFLLTNVQVLDDLISLDCSPATPTSLVQGGQIVCTGSYQVTQEDVDAGEPIFNTATATGRDPDEVELEDQDDVSVPVESASPAIALNKEITDGSPFLEVEDVIEYRLTATNTGNVTLSNVEISDPDAELGDCVPTQPATLQPGDTLICDATYSVSQEDIDNGEFINLASVTGTAPDDSEVGDQDDATAPGPVAGPSLVVLKQANTGGPIALDDVIEYTITVTNNGNVTLTEVEVEDSLIDIECSPETPLTLAPTEQTICTGSYTVNQADIDAGEEIVNLATATGVDPESEVVEDDDEVAVPVVDASPAIELIKEADTEGPVFINDVIEYTITVTNIGNVTLTDVDVTDDMIDLSCVPDLPSELAPEDSVVCTGSYEVQPGDIGPDLVNTASTTGRGPDDSVVDDGDDATVSTRPPIPVPVSGTAGMITLFLLLLLVGLGAASRRLVMPSAHRPS